VDGLDNVFAAGDMTTFPVKHGGLAAQQAEAAAETIAAIAGAPVTPRPFRPVLRGLVLTGGIPVYLRTELGGGRGETSTFAEDFLWWPPGKIVGRYLAPFLASYKGVAAPAEPPAGPGVVPVEIDLSDESVDEAGSGES
jgi:sulfide:quinone oxidoreductase